MTKRVLIAGLVHETHSFVPAVTGPADFRTLRGDALWREEGGPSCLAGGLLVARERGWRVLPAAHMQATPGPVVADAAIELWWQAVQEAIAREAAHGLDGVWLNLHGAMVSQSLPDVEGELLRRIRSLPACAGIPIGGVLDLHGNFSAEMAAHSNAFVAYRKNPHTDGKEAAADSARLLDRLMRSGERAVTVWERPPLILPPAATGTADQPMSMLEARARAIEAAHPDMLAVNVFAGFAYSDMPDAGVSFWAVTVGDRAAAGRELRSLSDIALAQRERALPSGFALDDALDRAQAVRGGPALIVEPADNIGGGAPGDLTIVLGRLLERDVRNAGVILADEEAVRALWPLDAGQRKRLFVGGKSGVIGAQPLELEVEVISKSDGAFELEDRHSHMAVGGLQWSMGPTVVVRSAGVTLMLTTHKMAPFDLAQWRSQGIDPERFAVINVKAAVAHRQAYDPIAAASFTVDTPGPCANDVRILPYTRLKRPVYPLDAV